MNINRQKLTRAALIAAPFLLIVILFLSVILFMEPVKPTDNSSYIDLQSCVTSLPDTFITQDDLISSEPSVSQSSSDNSAWSEISSAPSIPASAPSSVPTDVKNETVAVSETKAVWVSFLEMQNILKGKNEEQYTASVKKYFDNLKQSGFNTVIFHARSHGDAFYKSKLFPTSVHFTITRKASADFDPLLIAINEAHKRGLIIEAWINPYRGPQVKDGEPLEPNGIFAKWVGSRRVFTAENGGKTYYYFNPAHPEAQEYVLNGVLEILNNYDIDGIHFDDYFYPTTAEWVDNEEYQRYGGNLSLGDFRRKTVSDFIARIYKAVKAKGKTFGISPAGNIKSNTDYYYADVKLWGSKTGYVDYLMPQIYWSYDEGTLPFEKALKEWNQLVSCDSVKLKVGLAAYKVGSNDYWTANDILARQIRDSKACKGYAGYALFRYENVFSEQCSQELKNILK